MGKPKIDVNNPPEAERGTCPNCGEDRLWVGKNFAFNSLSKGDNKTYLCSPCGGGYWRDSPDGKTFYRSGKTS